MSSYVVITENVLNSTISICSFVLFAVAGNFISPNIPINVSLTEGEPYLLPCPPRSYSYRVSYDWEAIVGSRLQSIANNQNFAPRILMEPNGDLLFSYVNRSDVNLNPLRCRVIDLFGNSLLGPNVFLNVTSPGKSMAG